MTAAARAPLARSPRTIPSRQVQPGDVLSHGGRRMSVLEVRVVDGIVAARWHELKQAA